MKEKNSMKSRTSRKLLFGLTASLLFTGCNSNNKKIEPTDTDQTKIESSVDNNMQNHKEKHHYETMKGDINSKFTLKEKGNQLEKKQELSYQTGSRVLSIRNYRGCSIVDALNSIGYDSSFRSRSKLAKKYGIKNYRGTSKQNTKLLKKLKKDNFSNKKNSKSKEKKNKKTKKDKLISVIVTGPIEIVKPIVEPTTTPRPTRRPRPTILPTTRPIETTKPQPTASPTGTPVGTKAPVETAKPTGTPVGTKAPVETAKPTGTPVGTKAPVETAKPTGRPVPVVTASPTGTPIPVVTASPTGTPIPVVTISPTGTPIPVVTISPTGTPIPVVTISPTGTPIPVVTASPTGTPVPVVTASPTGTPVPVVTASPTTTPELCQHGVYDEIIKTDGDNEYCYHISYVCNKCDETISMDSEANKHSFVEYDNRPYDWYKECSKCFYTIDLPQETLAELIVKSKMMLSPDYRPNPTSNNHYHSCLERTAKTYIKRK